MQQEKASCRLGSGPGYTGIDGSACGSEARPCQHGAGPAGCWGWCEQHGCLQTDAAAHRSRRQAHICGRAAAGTRRRV